MKAQRSRTSRLLAVVAGTVAVAGVLGVVSAAFALSFDAIRAVAVAAHIRPSLAWLFPVAVDGAMSVATVCAVVLRARGRSAAYPWLVVLFGALVSVVANALHAWVDGGSVALPGTWAVTLSAVPPVLLALSIHLLIVLALSVSDIQSDSDSDAAKAAATAPPVGTPVGAPALRQEPANLTATAPPVGAPALRQEPASGTATEPANVGDSEGANEGDSGTAKAAATAPPVGTPVGTPDQRQEAANLTATEPATAPPVGAPALRQEPANEPAKAAATAPPKQKSQRTPKPRKSNAERVAAAVALTPDATVAELATRLKLSARTVQRYRPAAKAAAVAAASAPSVNGRPVIDGEVTSNADD